MTAQQPWPGQASVPPSPHGAPASAPAPGPASASTSTPAVTPAEPPSQPPVRSPAPAPAPASPPATVPVSTGRPPASPGTLELREVSRWYGNVVAVNGVSMTIGPGVTGLLGPNGAGKSTLIHMMGGFMPASSGSVTLNGTAIWRNPSVYRDIGLVPERETAYGFLTGRQFVHSMAKLHKLPDPAAAARRAISLVEMEYAQEREIGTYSKGMKQRIKMASALVHDPAVLLLDEPFNGMDPRQRLQLMDLIRSMAAEGRTILFSSHILEEVERLANHIEVVVAGRHAASGDFRAIRRLMTDRPHVFSIRSSDDRALASAIIADGSARSVQLADGGLRVEAVDFRRFTWLLPQVARTSGIRLWEVSPADESLESVFSYLVAQ